MTKTVKISDSVHELVSKIADKSKLSRKAVVERMILEYVKNRTLNED